MTDISNGADIYDQFQSTLDNVDEMFSKLSIPEIQRLSSQYNAIIAKTKDELHNLVSDKYRDLIKIAEDIGDLRNKSLTIEENLQEISYKPSTFVSPYKDSYAKFDSIVRDQNATEAKRNSRSVIVRNVIQKRLAKLASKVSCEGPSPLLHTSNFIPFVKELYTIETVFQDVLNEKKDLQQQIKNIKDHLLEYFEYEITVYNFPLTLFNSNDKFSLRQRFLEKDFTTDPQSKLADNLSIIGDDFDEFSDGDDDDAHDEFQEKHERFDKLDIFKHTNYNRNVLALCNYLVCYTILSNDNSSSEAVKHKLIDLRMRYLNKLLSLLDQNNHTVNYRLVFLYLENTCNYLRGYFGDSASSDYFRTLRDIAKPWSLVELVGHKGWIDDKKVDFGKAIDVKREKTEVSLKDFNKLMGFISQLVTSSSQSEASFTIDSLSTSIVKYYSFITSLKRLDDATKNTGSLSQLVELVSKSQLLNKMSENLEVLIKKIYESHILKLMSEKGVLGTVLDVLESAIGQRAIHNAFDADVVNLMDYNLGEYMNLVMNNDQNANKTSYNTTHQLNQWLNECFQLRKITDFDRDTSLLFTGQMDIYDYLPQLYHNLQNDGVQWGNFTANTLKERFHILHATVNQSFNQEISKFCIYLLKLSAEKGEVSKLIYLIGLLTNLRDVIKYNSTETNNDTKELITTMDSNIDKLFQKVVSHVLDDKVDHIRQLILTKESEVDAVDIPTRPNLQLALRLYELAQIFLTQANKIESKNVSLFLNSSSTLDQFVRVKNEWFEKLIEMIVSKINTSKDSESNEVEAKEYKVVGSNGDSEHEAKENNSENLNGESEKMKDDETKSNGNSELKAKENKRAESNRDPSQSRTSILQTAANIAFIQLFYKSKIDAQIIRNISDSLHATADQQFNENTLEIISSGVSSFYKTRKNVYLPLLS